MGRGVMEKPAWVHRAGVAANAFWGGRQLLRARACPPATGGKPLEKAGGWRPWLGLPACAPHLAHASSALTTRPWTSVSR